MPCQPDQGFAALAVQQPETERMSTSTLSAVVALRASSSFLSEEVHAESCNSTIALPRHFFFGLGLALTACMGGGLIFGCAPFQNALVHKYGYSMADTAAVWGRGFEMFVFGTAILSPFLDVVGPRWFAVAGAAMEWLGHNFLTRTASFPVTQGVDILSFAYGMVGLGGNMLMLASVQFCQLYSRSSTAAALLMGAYQSAGFIFTIFSLTNVDFSTFFGIYQVISLVGLAVVLLSFPDKPCESPQDAHCSLPVACTWLCTRTATVDRTGIGSLGRSLAPLKRLRTWLFLLSFSMAATCGAWCDGIFLSELNRKAAADPAAKNKLSQLIFWMPLVSNATFFFTPLIGALIDSHGFPLAVQLLFAVIALLVLSLWLLPLAWQWLTLLLLNWLQAVTYTLQFAYITRRYASDQFGAVMSFSTLAQAAVNPLGVYLLSAPLFQAAIAFIPCSLVLCGLWSWQETARPA
ncbi:unnamed protein product [Effrenium voratum]|uniref:Uncharacterized protein n=1 Tax=Effrenium voratum TaxID=2562239 RepID=A0AA36JN90_9DINO|nr:unnamed protein product [Effrenium voratum]CAJ1413587.1 unnamed protein product [Effrenium voratum]